MKLSMITCAALPKSPNCASQRTRLVGRGGRVAVLEAEAGRPPRAGCCGARTGASAPARFWIGTYLQARLLVVEDEVAVGEGAALGVLAGEADVGALGQQRGERERLGVAELDPAPRPAPRSGASSGLRSLRWIVKLSGTRRSSSFSVAQALARRPRSRRSGSWCGRARRCRSGWRSGPRTRPTRSSR